MKSDDATPQSALVPEANICRADSVDVEPYPNPIDSVQSTDYVSISREVQRAVGYWGAPGEFTASLQLAEMGYETVIGPGGAAGKALNASGFDIIAVNHATKHVLIADNKASGQRGPVRGVSAFERLPDNLAGHIEEIKALQDFPDKAVVVDALEETLRAVKAGGGSIPDSVQFAVTNAGGIADGLGSGVADKFAEYKLTYSSGNPVEVGFEYLTPKTLIEDAASQLDALKAAGKRVGRGLTEATVTEDVMKNVEVAAEAPNALHASYEGAAMGLAMLMDLATSYLRGLAEEARIKQELDRVIPEITRQLTEHPEWGAMLSWDIWKDTSFDFFEGHRAPVFAGISVYYGTSPESTYAHGAIRFGSLYAEPPTDGGRAKWVLSNKYQWYDGTKTYSWEPTPPAE